MSTILALKLLIFLYQLRIHGEKLYIPIFPVIGVGKGYFTFGMFLNRESSFYFYWLRLSKESEYLYLYGIMRYDSVNLRSRKRIA